MNSVLEIFGYSVPVYGLMYFTGIFVAAAAALLLRGKKVPLYEIVYSAVYAVLGGLVGAKLLFIFISLPQIIQLQIPFSAVLKGGFVFYGGLIGGLLGLLIYCLQFHISFLQMADLYAVVLPLGHALGRVGCYAAGCCYGIPYDGPFAVTYHEVLGNTPLDTPLLPIQLIEAVCLVILFGILAILYKTKSRDERELNGEITAYYALAYAVIRFVLECFRGDGERGLWWHVSTSQWISIALFVFGVCLLLRKRRLVKQG